MASILFFIGALVPTFLISRVLLFATRGWTGGGYRRLALCHAGSLLIASFIGGMGMADGGAFAGVEALLAYALPQAVWLVFDAWRLWRRQPEAAGPRKDPTV